jgi:tetratricopeptide (TPR) repeat protein
MRRFGFAPATWAVLVSALQLAVACAPGAARKPALPPSAAQATIARAVPVTEDDFPLRAHTVLVSGARDQQRLELLAGVVNRQLARAEARFSAGHADAGLRAVTGAVLLQRVGEGTPLAFSGRSRALAAAAEEMARAGDEGRALAFYQALLETLPVGAERDDVTQHLQALEGWVKNLERSGPLQAAGARQQTAVHRSLIDVSPAALKEARAAVLDWILRAQRVDMDDYSDQAQREEVVQAFKAVRAGTATLVGLYLRHGDAAGAAAVSSGQELERLVAPGLVTRLDRASDGDARAWADLYELFAQAAAEKSELTVDAELAKMAAWGAALELYRLQPKSLRHALPLSELLLEFGMSDVVPVVLGKALDAEPRSEDLGLVLSFVLRGILTESELGDLSGARRVFAAASPVFKAADALKRPPRPSAARVRYVMGAVETQYGALDRALPLLQQAWQREPDNLEAGRLAVLVQRQRGERAEARELLAKVETAARARGDAFTLAELGLTRFELDRDDNKLPDAERALEASLQAALAARTAARKPAELGRAERILARVLESAGDRAGAERASERAWEAAQAEPDQLAPTLLDAGRRALTLRDLRGLRTVAQRSLDARLEDDDLVYVAAWLRLVERALGEPSDGTVESALARLTGGQRWPDALRDWLRGKLDDAGLKARARTAAERAEATFYAVLAARGVTATPELEEVAKSPAVELIEVTVARDLLAPRLKVELPSANRVP